MSGTVTVGFSSDQGGSFVANETTYTYSTTLNGIYYYIGNNVTAVGALNENLTLVSVDIGSGVSSIGYGAFPFCTALSTVTIPNSVTTIGSSAFNGCTTLPSVIIPNSVTSIGDNAFYGCSQLTSVTIGTGVTTIGETVFYYCWDLASITIPNSVTSIGDGAFQGCSTLASVTFLQRSNILLFGGTYIFDSTPLATAYMYIANTNAKEYLNANYTGVTINYLDNVVCFLEGSKILTEKGYVKIEELKNGDLVKTALDGYKKIDMIGWREIHHVGIERRIKDQLYKCTKENYPEILEDLIITGCHSILVDDFKNEKEKKRTIEINGDTYVTGNKYRLPACADERTVVYEKKGYYKVYHVALENDDYYKNYGIYANGLLVESCSIGYLKELSGMVLL